jgi:hypothetical protein
MAATMIRAVLGPPIEDAEEGDTQTSLALQTTYPLS